jgi:hypothetical protein
MHNVAQYWWCAMYSVLKSRKNEWQFFRSVLADTCRYAMRLGLIQRPPKSGLDLLDIRKHIRDKDAERIGLSDSGPDKRLLPEPFREFVGDLEFGDEAPDPDAEYAESYPKYRWNFRWRDYVLVGIPDGITSNFVYEFKSAATDSLFRRVARPVGKTQCDLYGLFFRRDRKRLQIYIREEQSVSTIDTSVDELRARETLSKFKAADRKDRIIPPQRWKCKSCEFFGKCTVRQAAQP